MRSRRTPTWGDLALLILSAACIVVAIKSSIQVVDIIAGLPLVIYLPGAALVTTFDPRAPDENVLERQMWNIGASFVLSVTGGLVLNLVSSLTRSHWLFWSGAIIAVCLVLKLVLALITSRGIRKPVPHEAEVSNISNSDDARSGGPVESGNGTSIWRAVGQIIILFVAGAICVAALILSTHTQTLTTRESFVQAWVLPRPSEDVTSTRVELGLRNHLGSQRVFLVHVQVGSGVDEILDMFSVPLANGASWTQTITRQPGERVQSTVLISSRPSAVIAKVYLARPVK